MSAPSSPSEPGPSPRARANYANPGMRVSDAERSEVADRLSKHYGDGRLNQEEFDKRLHQAMSATTQADLHGLFADLPEDETLDAAAAGARSADARSADARSASAGRPAAAPQPGRRRPRRQFHKLLPLIVLVVIAAVIGHALSQLMFPWLLIGVVAVLWLRFGPRRRRL